MEQLASGHSDNVTIARLQTELQCAEGHMREESTEMKDTDPLRLRLWDETRMFYAEVLSKDKLAGVLLSLSQEAESSHGREQMLQESLSSFIQRMETVYKDSPDLYATVELALLQMKLGLRLVRVGSIRNSGGKQHIDVQMQTLMRYPSAFIVKAHLSDPAPSLACGEFRTTDDILMRVSSVLLDTARTGCRQSSHKVLSSAYRSFFNLWQKDRTQAAIEEKSAQSIYKQSSGDKEAELEEIAILEMFPTYDDQGEELPSNQSSRSVLISPQNGQEILDIHMQLFAQEPKGAAPDLLRVRIRQCAEEWIKNSFMTLSDAIDTCSVPFRARLLHGVREEIEHTSNRINFYRNSNISELKRLLPVLGSMRQQLRQLISAWPEQTVLQHLAEHCDKILSLRLDSPIAKALTAVEQFLQHTDDWEMYANRENSLQAYRQSLTQLIVDWRKLELSGWHNLLDNEAHLAESSVWEWWFRLYEILVQEPSRMCSSTDCTEGDLDAYMDRLDALLEDFVRGAPLGQFRHRLILLRSFKGFLEDLHLHMPSVMHQRTVNLLESLDGYYNRFIPHATKSLSEQRNALEKDIRDFIKLASWRDINVHSLRQSAKNSHRQLYKRVRKFRDILRQPISALLVDGVNYRSIETTVSLVQFTRQGVVGSLVQGSHVSQYTARFSLILVAAKGRICADSSAAAIDDLANLVITTADELANTPAPANLDSTRLKKWHASRMVRKRRAWNDLLKELKRIGVAPNVKPEVLAHQTNRRWLMELPNVGACPDSQAANTVQQIDMYFYRSLDVLFDLRSNVANHSDDITTRDLNRGVMLAESMFEVSIRCRNV
jgi:midasin